MNVNIYYKNTNLLAVMTTMTKYRWETPKAERNLYGLMIIISPDKSLPYGTPTSIKLLSFKTDSDCFSHKLRQHMARNQRSSRILPSPHQG